MAKQSRNAIAQPNAAAAAPAKTAASAKPKARSVAASAKPPASVRSAPEASRAAWATDLVFDVREPKLAVSLRLDADVLRFFRGFGAGYQTRINEVLKAFMQAREESDMAHRTIPAARLPRASNGKEKRARQ